MSLDKGTNILRDPKIKRIVEHDQLAKQINILDQRFYSRYDGFYASVTNILQYFPKNKYFESWLKDVSWSADIIAAKSASEGTQVHKAIEDMLNDVEIRWINDDGSVNYSLEVWKMILRFADFWNTHKPEVIASEYHVFSDVYKYAGTIDLVLKMRDKIWIVDIKTSNSLHTSHELQQSAYAIAWNETHDVKIDETSLLWLKASTHKPDSKGEKIQGKGWQLKTFDKHFNSSFPMFKSIYDIYLLENPDMKPLTESYPTSVKLVV